MYYFSKVRFFKATIPKIPLKIKKLDKATESLKQLPQGHKKQQFDFFEETKIILGDKRLEIKYEVQQNTINNFDLSLTKKKNFKEYPLISVTMLLLLNLKVRKQTRSEARVSNISIN